MSEPEVVIEVRDWSGLFLCIWGVAWFVVGFVLGVWMVVG